MKAKARNVLLKQYGNLYHTHYPLNHRPGTCFYCGDLKSEHDHCPPLSWVDAVITEKHNLGIELLRIPSCSDCNNILGDKPLFTPLERVQYIHEKLSAKYERGFTLWSDEELEEMSSDFQRVIKARRKKLSFLLERVKGSEWRLTEELLNV